MTSMLHIKKLKAGVRVAGSLQVVMRMSRSLRLKKPTLLRTILKPSLS
jgi:hypothetical protein